MKRIDVICGDAEHTFRTNDSGSYLFIGVAQNSQISCESGFNRLPRIKRFVKSYLSDKWEHEHFNDEPMPRLKFSHTSEFDA